MYIFFTYLFSSPFLFVRQVVIPPNRHFWTGKALDAWFSPRKQAFFHLAESILLLRFPFGLEASILAASIIAAARVWSQAEKVKVLEAMGQRVSISGIMFVVRQCAA